MIKRGIEERQELSLGWSQWWWREQIQRYMRWIFQSMVDCRFTLSLPAPLTPVNSWQFWVSTGRWWQKGGGKFLKRRKTRWKGVSRLGCRFSRSFCRFTLLLPLVPLFKPFFKCCFTVTCSRLICCLFSCAKRRKICSCIALTRKGLWPLGGDTPLYRLYKYVRHRRVWFFSHFCEATFSSLSIRQINKSCSKCLYYWSELGNYMYRSETG